MTSLLLTSFAPWRAHQLSNSSDDLIDQLQAHDQIPVGTELLRRLPVHFQLAPCQVIAAMVKVRPAIVVCCGMAETRSQLTLEHYGRSGPTRLATALDLSHLAIGTQWTTCSDDAGDYVCNHLYFEVLHYIQRQNLSTQCLFVHVPVLTPDNQTVLRQDFALILQRLQAIASLPNPVAA